MTNLTKEIKQTEQEIKSARKEHCDDCSKNYTCVNCKEQFAILQGKLEGLKQGQLAISEMIEKIYFPIEKVELQLSSSDPDDWEMALEEVRHIKKELDKIKSEVSNE